MIFDIKKNEESDKDNLRNINNQSVMEELTIEQLEEKALEGKEPKPNVIGVD